MSRLILSVVVASLSLVALGGCEPASAQSDPPDPRSTTDRKLVGQQVCKTFEAVGTYAHRASAVACWTPTPDGNNFDAITPVKPSGLSDDMDWVWTSIQGNYEECAGRPMRCAVHATMSGTAVCKRNHPECGNSSGDKEIPVPGTGQTVTAFVPPGERAVTAQIVGARQVPLGLEVWGTAPAFRKVFLEIDGWPDVDAADASGNFRHTLWFQATGAHRVCGWAASATFADVKGEAMPCQDFWMNPRTVMGKVEAVNQRDTGDAAFFSGWVLDMDTTSPVPIDVYFDGVFQGNWIADKAHDSVAQSPAYQNFGFSDGFPIPPGHHQICLGAVDVDMKNARTGAVVGLGCFDFNRGTWCSAEFGDAVFCANGCASSGGCR